MKHQYSIDELKHRENLMQAQLEDEQARREELEEHKVHGCPLGTRCPALPSPSALPHPAPPHLTPVPPHPLPLPPHPPHPTSPRAGRCRFLKVGRAQAPKTCHLVENSRCPGALGHWSLSQDSHADPCPCPRLCPTAPRPLSSPRAGDAVPSHFSRAVPGPQAHWSVPQECSFLPGCRRLARSS